MAERDYMVMLVTTAGFETGHRLGRTLVEEGSAGRAQVIPGGTAQDGLPAYLQWLDDVVQSGTGK